jgi:predicted MPP superfamily phosphohydrolase
MIIVLEIMFSVFVLGLLVCSMWYVPFRFSRLLGLGRTWPLYFAEALNMALFLVSMGFQGVVTNSMLTIVANTTGVLFALHINLIMLFLLLDILRLVIHPPARLTAWLVVCVAIVATAGGAWKASHFEVTTTEIPIVGLEKDVTLMHISDVHIGPHRGSAYLERIVGETNRLQPDLVLINGDLVDAKSALEPGFLSALGRLEAPAYFTTGNHESYVDTERTLEIISSYGVRVLRNEIVETHGFQLVGLDYMKADENTFDMHVVNKLTIKEELPKIPFTKGKPVVLMHHSPVGLEYVSARGVSLMLSGHTHAGQMFPGTWLAPLIFPLNNGLHKRQGTYFFVSQGAGTYMMRLRLGSSNEINLIHLRKG